MRIIVIGHGMVGHRFLEVLAQEQAKNIGHTPINVTVLAEENKPAYDRVQLSSYFSGKSADDLSLVQPDFFAQTGFTLRLGCPAVAIDSQQKTVTTQAGEVLPFDKLILATGSYPFVPPLAGKDRPECLVYRTLDDLDSIRAQANSSKVGVVIGGGLLGLEAAKALRDLNLETHVVEFASRLMAVQIDDGAGKLLRQKIESLGVGVHTQKNTTEITDGSTQKLRMNFADGSHLETDLIVFSAGIRPQDTLAKEAGIELGARGGIIVNNYCQTNHPDIYAIGECALWSGKIFGLVAPGYQMAEAVAHHLLETAHIKEFLGADMSTKLKLLGVNVASIGDAHAQTAGAKCYFYIDEPAEVYKKIVVSKDGKHLLGAVLIGDTDDYGNLLQLMLNNMTLPEQPQSLILPSLSGEKPAFGVESLPEMAQICSCNNISKGDICQSVANGNLDFDSVKSCTKAASSCGGCTALVKQVINHELTKMGVEVKKDLCEHFVYNRQELYHIIKSAGVKDFDTLLKQHGNGQFDGCDICKPTAANIFASIYNEHVLKKPLAKLQDTNDYFMANMQKDGTYSVVPRMAGGEVTPDGLIAVGQVAKKYNLYTKLTGGQRVDLFGARLEQLPLIWEELIHAGFETGHAYGKSLRTVKSCVGSTWCRYGMLDSVAMAIRLENRYKGLRAPHKIKMAVSGCTRECAEAQSKDVGVIATENGWNLYVCGNGGMKPRHAELFATALDDAMLIKYIDRLLMFYVKTADRLQRTSVWRDNMEGGLDYLKAVVIDDSLGLATGFEAQMASIVSTYQDEWATAVNTPEIRNRFKSFINSDKADDNIQFVEVRGQIRPATVAEKLGAEKPPTEKSQQIESAMV